MAKDAFRAGRTTKRPALRPAVESLEGRRLLATTLYGGKLVGFDHATYVVKLAGPGKVSVQTGKAGLGINVIGSTGGSALTIKRVATSAKYGGSLLPVAKINVTSGAIGQVLASGTVDLLGTLSAKNPISDIQLGAVGPAARINAIGGLGSLTVSGAIDLGPKGMIAVAGDLQKTLQAGSITLEGGRISVAENLGGISTSSLIVGDQGQFLVGGDAGTIQAGAVDLTGGTFSAGGIDALSASSLEVGLGGQFRVGSNATSLAPGAVDVTGGLVSIGQDIGTFAPSSLSVGAGGQFIVGHDATFGAAPVDVEGGQISIGADLAGLTSSSLVVGPGGQFLVGHGTGTLAPGTVAINGGLFSIGQNLGGLSALSLTVGTGGQFLVGQDAGPIAISQVLSLAGGSFTATEDAGNLSVGGNLAITAGGRLAVGRDLVGTVTVGGLLSIDASQLYIGRDLNGSTAINGGISATDAGFFTVGRDVTGSLGLGGNLSLATGGLLAIGRTIGSGSDGSSGLSVGGNLIVGTGSAVTVGGDLDGLKVGGTILGQGTDAIDLSVGLDLNNFAVSGGSSLGGVTNFNAAIGKNIVGISVLHGFFNDFITAGVQITNATVGADGPIAVFDTEIRAGLSITNVTFGGDVESDRPTNATGRRTRIVAGEDRAGNFEIGGTIDNFQITGSLIDAAVAASVQPYGGNGSNTVTPAPAPAAGAPDYYDAPGGGNYVGFNSGLFYAAPPFNTAIDPDVHDNVLPGQINHSFTPTTATAPYPTESTVLGAVITTAHANDSDYAGFFAKDTGSIFVGVIP